MSRPALKIVPHANGRDAYDLVRSKAHDLRVASIPAAAEAAEKAGQAIASFALSTSRSMAKSIRDATPSAASDAASEAKAKAKSGLATLGAVPVVHQAARFVRRNPVLTAAIAAGALTLGYAAMRWQAGAREDADADSEHSSDEA
ncbi:hypothetical protein [Sphingobium lignivorans]|uniref:DUF3618 domain-containing protein n=1 Tax=Sphingobium lignivorans TaxID=2735886 RepID=A0ABR6NCK6_9SPHN|nr:hypothetical protein [Sphingobium lignivorans]MBB5985003.1 hypothetical protein [Sphingobium lignivorans]